MAQSRNTERRGRPFPARFTLNKAVLLTVLTALLPITTFGIVQGLWGREYARQLISERLITSALATMAVQREPIEAAMRTLTTLASDPDIVAPTDRCNAILARNLSIQKSIVNFARVDAKGFVQCSALTFEKPLNNGRPPWWYKAIADRRFTLSPPHVGRISKRRVISGMLPFFDKTGQFKGAVLAAIDASWIEKALEQRKLSPQAVVVVTGPAGQVLIGKGQRFKTSFNLRGSFGATSMIEATDGSKWMYSSAPLYKDQLYVAYAEPARILLASSRSQLRINVILPLLTLVFTSLAIWWAMNQFVIRWLRSLSALATQIARGDYTAQLTDSASPPAELAALGVDLRDMALAIATRDSELRAATASTFDMAREVNHRVKNNLQMVMSLLGVHSARLTDSEAIRALDQTRMRIGAISLIHRLLYEFDTGGEKGQVDLAYLMQELCVQLRYSLAKEGVRLECQCSIGLVSVDQAIPLALLIVEAVTNAYRHGFPDGRSGCIAIVLADRDGQCLLTVTDDGVGFDAGDIQGGLGRELMHAFASQLGGTLDIRSSPGNGVAISLRFARQWVEQTKETSR